MTSAPPSRGQRRVVWAALMLVVPMLIVPPWVNTLHVGARGQRIDAEWPAGYALIFAPPRPGPGAAGVRVDFSRLLLQIAIIGLVAGALYWQTQARPALGEGAAPQPRSPGPPSAPKPTSSGPDVSPTMAKLFGSDGELVPEVLPFDERDLLSVEPDTLLPMWWPDANEEGIRWSPRQRIHAFEHDLRACIEGGIPRTLGADADSELMRIVAGLRFLRSVVTT